MQEARKQICEIGRRIYDKGFVAANDGNISVKLPDGTFLCTPTGVSKGFMTPDMLCRVDGAGNVLGTAQNLKPSSEILMHLRVYGERSDVTAVVHAHPPYATSYAIANIPLCGKIMPEAVIMLGCVPIARYGTPSTREIPDAVAPFLPHFDAVLLANHGALSFGMDLLTAYHKMESMEFYAQLSYLSHNLGGAKELTPEQVSGLYEVRRQFNLPGKHPMDICGPGCPFKSENACG
jgi:L-fuculose-phosphate aldolase